MGAKGYASNAQLIVFYGKDLSLLFTISKYLRLTNNVPTSHQGLACTPTKIYELYIHHLSEK